VVASLIKRDKLDQKANWDTAWLLPAGSDLAGSYPVTKVTVPKNADALVNYTNGAIAAGGVMLTPAQTLATPPEKDEKGTLDAAKKKGQELRSAAKGDAAVVVQP
jgi:hypothetical protein